MFSANLYFLNILWKTHLETDFGCIGENKYIVLDCIKHLKFPFLFKWKKKFQRSKKIETRFNIFGSNDPEVRNYRNNHRKCSIKKSFPKISSNSQKNTYEKSLFNKAWCLQVFQKRGRCFPVNLKFEFDFEVLGTSFLQNNTSRRLLLFSVWSST